MQLDRGAATAIVVDSLCSFRGSAAVPAAQDRRSAQSPLVAAWDEPELPDRSNGGGAGGVGGAGGGSSEVVGSGGCCCRCFLRSSCCSFFVQWLDTLSAVLLVAVGFLCGGSSVALLCRWFDDCFAGFAVEAIVAPAVEAGVCAPCADRGAAVANEPSAHPYGAAQARPGMHGTCAGTP